MNNDEGWQQFPKVRRFFVMMTRGHGGMACMAQKHHGDGDVDGPLHNISNVGVTYVNGWKVCYVGREMEGLEVMHAKGKMMSRWCGVVLLYRKHSRPWRVQHFP